MPVTIDRTVAEILHLHKPIQIVVSGYPTERAAHIGALGWPSAQCQHVDCNQAIFFSPERSDAALDVFEWRECIGISAEDDELVYCCWDHDIDTGQQAIVGRDVYLAHELITAEQ